MARTHKAERMYQAEIVAVRYRLRVLETIDTIVFLGLDTEKDSEKVARKAAQDFGVDWADVYIEKGSLW